MAKIVLMNMKRIIIVSLLLLTISSCRKDEKSVPVDETLKPYFGDWEFTYYHYEVDYIYVPDSTGGHYEEWSNTHVEEPQIGEISMGSKNSELEIKFNKNDVAGYLGTINVDNGSMYCSGNCDYINWQTWDGSAPSWSAHHIYGTEYQLDLGGISSGSSSDWYEIKGVKL